MTPHRTAMRPGADVGLTRLGGNFPGGGLGVPGQSLARGTQAGTVSARE